MVENVPIRLSAKRQGIAEAARDGSASTTPSLRPYVPLRRGRLLVSLLLAAIIPLLLFGASVAYLEADARRAMAREDAAHTLSSVAERVTIALKKEIEVGEALAALPSLDRPELDRFYRTAQRIAPRRPLWETVSLADTSGTQTLNILRKLGDPLGPVSDRRSFDQAIATETTVIGGLGPVGPVSGKRLVSLCIPVIREGAVKLVLIIGLSPTEIQGILNRAGAPKDWIGAIVDAGGNVMAGSSGSDEVGRPASEAVKSGSASAWSGEYRGRSANGVMLDTLYRTLPGTNGWTVHFGVPSATLNGPVSRTTGFLVGSSVVCLLLAVGLAQLAARDLEQRRLQQEDYAGLLLALSEERAAVAIEAAALGTWRLDFAARGFTGSLRTQFLLQLPPADGSTPSWSVDAFFAAIHVTDLPNVRRAFADCERQGTALDVEFRARRDDKGFRWLRAAGRSLRQDGPGSGTGATGSTIVHGVLADIDSSKRAGSERMLLMKRLAEAQENEQRRISRELHDQVGQSLTGLSLGLKKLEQDLDVAESSSLRDRIVWLESLTSDISRDIHRAAADLRPNALDDLGLTGALAALAGDLKLRHAISFDVQTIGLAERLDTNVEIAIFRIVQEAFTNALKHAEATTVSAILERRGERLQIVIEDDGVGFDPADVGAEDLAERADRGHKFGLSSIRERLAILGGNLKIESVKGLGTSLYIDIKLGSGKD